MTFFNIFRQPYLNEDNGVDLGGGNAPDDVILPDDFTPSTEELNENPVMETTPTEEPKQEPEQPKIKVKYLHEEKEISLDEARELAQKGMNYDRLQERLNALQNDPRLSFVETQAKRYGMTVDQYLEAVRQQEEQERLNELVQKNIPEEYAKEIMENRKFREQYDSQQREAQAKERQQAEYKDFIDSFPDIKPEDIKSETWIKVNQGVPLKYAFMEQKMAEMANEVNVLKTNQANTKKAPVSGASSNGSHEIASEDDFLKGFNSI
jgi:hypothetical protein